MTVRVNLRGSVSGVTANCKLCGQHAKGTSMYLAAIKVDPERSDLAQQITPDPKSGRAFDISHVCYDCNRAINLVLPQR